MSQLLEHPVVAVPPLVAGDRLARDEFERRYDAMPDGLKFELIEGIVYITSPVYIEEHGGPHADLVAVVGFYRAYTPGVLVGDNSSVRLDVDNMPQPDVCVFVDPRHGGSAKIEGKILTGAPELVLEVSSSTVNFDLHQKLRAYRDNGVSEYIVWRTRDRAFDHFVAESGRFDPVTTADGVIRSRVFPGLWVNTPALVGGRLLDALDEVQRGLATPEHAAFAASLAGK